MKLHQKMNRFGKKITVFALAGVMAAGLSVPALAGTTEDAAVTGTTASIAASASTATVKAAAVKKAG